MLIIKNGTMQKRLRGFTLLELMVALVILSGLASVIGPKIIQQDVPIAQAKTASNEISQIKAAANSYYMENRAWPSSVNELIAAGYFTGTQQSPFGTNYSLSTSGHNLVISVDTSRKQLANILAGQVLFGSVDATGKIVSTAMGTPTRAAVESYYLARKTIPGCSDCNTLASGTNLDFNGNDLQNVGHADMQLANIEQATIQKGVITDLNIEALKLGNNSISYNGSNLDLNASTIRLNGNVNLNGDLQANNHNLIGIGTVQALKGDFAEIAAQKGVIKQLSGDSLIFGTGQITYLTGESLNYKSGSIASLQGNTFTYNTGTVGNLSGTSLNYGGGTIGTLGGNKLTYSNGTIGDLSGSSINYTNGTFGTVISSTGRYSNLYVTGHSSLNTLGANYGTINNFSGQVANVKSGNFGSVTTDSLYSPKATIDTLSSKKITTNFLTTGTFNSDSVSITGTFSVGETLTSKNVTVTDKTTTNTLQSSNSDLGVALASKLTVSGQVQAGSANATTVNASNGAITQLTGNQATYDTVTANQYNGGTYTGSNFTTGQSSVNNNKSLIDQYISKWNTCQNAGGCK